MNVLESLREHVVVAVLRAPTPEAAISGVAALAEGGLRAVEITYSTPEAPSVIAQLVKAYGDDLLVGAGTVTTPQQVAEAVDAGAQYLVSPGTSVPVAEEMRSSGRPFAIGALTPSEVMAATDLGADLVKLFPGSLGGPPYLRALRGPFPDVPFMPTGGVTEENAASWLEAGAVCLGAGSDLVSGAMLARGDHDEIAQRAKAFMAAVARVPRT